MFYSEGPKHVWTYDRFEKLMISIIIPTLNEETSIGYLLDELLAEPGDHEIFVIDGGSRDRTIEVAKSRPGITVSTAHRGRAWQMNRGADLAQGDILLFLHADTILQPGWYRAIRQVMQGPMLLGAFRFRINDPAPWYRLLEWGVWLRCRLRDLPYGDQALFIRKQDFDALDGYRSVLFLEDVDFVRRCRETGSVHVLSHAAYTSSRRWQQVGFLRQTWRNWVTYLRFCTGTPIHNLLRSHDGPRRAILLFCKWPEPGQVKTRLAATVGDEKAASVYRSLLYSTLASVQLSKTDADCWIYFAPANAENSFRNMLNGTFHYAPQCEGDLGQRMLDSFLQSKKLGYAQVLIVGTDCPDVRACHIDQAFAALSDHDLVLGPTDDGGYYLIGANEPQPDLFRDIKWSTDSVYAETQKRVDHLGLRCARLEGLRDVDTEEDVRALIEQP